MDIAKIVIDYLPVPIPEELSLQMIGPNSGTFKLRVPWDATLSTVYTAAAGEYSKLYGSCVHADLIQFSIVEDNAVLPRTAHASVTGYRLLQFGVTPESTLKLSLIAPPPAMRYSSSPQRIKKTYGGSRVR